MSNTIMSEEFLAKAKSAKSFEELKALVAAEGVEVADDELMAKWTELSGGAKKFKLSEEELDNVAGGCDDGPMYSRIDFQCPNCGRSYCWYDAHEPVGDRIPCCDKCGTKMYVSQKYD